MNLYPMLLSQVIQKEALRKQQEDDEIGKALGLFERNLPALQNISGGVRGMFGKKKSSPIDSFGIPLSDYF